MMNKNEEANYKIWIQRLVQRGCSIPEIQKVTGLSVDRIKKIEKTLR